MARPELRRHIPQPGIPLRGRRPEHGLEKIGVAEDDRVDHEIDGNSVATKNLGDPFALEIGLSHRRSREILAEDCSGFMPAGE